MQLDLGPLLQPRAGRCRDRLLLTLGLDLPGEGITTFSLVSHQSLSCDTLHRLPESVQTTIFKVTSLQHSGAARRRRSKEPCKGPGSPRTIRHKKEDALSTVNLENATRYSLNTIYKAHHIAQHTSKKRRQALVCFRGPVSLHLTLPLTLLLTLFLQCAQYQASKCIPFIVAMGRSVRHLMPLAFCCWPDFLCGTSRALLHVLNSLCLECSSYVVVNLFFYHVQRSLPLGRR